MALLESLALGLALGVRHAVEPDHLAAITTLVDGRSPFAAARTGAAWGLGHAAALVLLGGVLVALGVRMPPRLALVLDLAVAAMLVVLAALSVRAARRPEAAVDPHAHAHAHDGLPLHVHAHAHAHAHAPARTGLRSTLVGFVHGASGTAALTLLCVTTMPSRGAAFAFLVVFGLGALVSMSVMSGVLAAPLSAVAKRGDRGLRWVRVCGAVVAIAAAVLVTFQAATGV